MNRTYVTLDYLELQGSGRYRRAVGGSCFQAGGLSSAVPRRMLAQNLQRELWPLYTQFLTPGSNSLPVGSHGMILQVTENHSPHYLRTWTPHLWLGKSRGHLR